MWICVKKGLIHNSIRWKVRLLLWRMPNSPIIKSVSTLSNPNKSHFRQLSRQKIIHPLHRTVSGTITGTSLISVWDLICADRTISLSTVCVSTVHNTSSGLTVHPKHVVGLRSCSLREEHPTVSALKSTAISTHHKIPILCFFYSKVPSELHHSSTNRKT